MAQTKFPLMALLRRPTPLLVVLATTSTGAFLAAGWLAAEGRFLGINWSGFHEQAALLFLAAWAQLVLAYAVWFQIRAANAATETARRQARSAESALEARDAEIRAGALLTFLGHAANASALYQMAYPALRDVVYSNAQHVSLWIELGSHSKPLNRGVRTHTLPSFLFTR